MSELKEYPKMLYRPALGKGNMVWGARVDTRIVAKRSEQIKAFFTFWIASPMLAVRISKVTNTLAAFTVKHSPQIIAAILALLVGIILFHYQDNYKNQKTKSEQQVLQHKFQTLKSPNNQINADRHLRRCFS